MVIDAEEKQTPQRQYKKKKHNKIEQSDKDANK